MAYVKSSGIIPLNDLDYPTWKIKVRMALMKDGLWNIVNRKERAPGKEHADQAKFMTRSDKAIAQVFCPYSLHYYIYLVIKCWLTNWSYITSYFPFVSKQENHRINM